MSLSAAELATLRALREAFPKQPLALIGAAALGLQVDMKWRRTADVDLVVVVSIDEAYAILTGREGWRRHDRNEHEWRSPSGVKVDLLPVSQEALAARTLRWPASGHEMNLTGIRHAFAAAPVALAPGLHLPVAPVHVIALLKIVAYLDRPVEREKDLSDVAHIFYEYPAIDDDRFFEDDILQLGLIEQEARPFILGREVAAIVDGDERAIVEAFCRRVLDDGPDGARWVRNGPWLHTEETAMERLERFLEGVRAT